MMLTNQRPYVKKASIYSVELECQVDLVLTVLRESENQTRYKFQPVGTLVFIDQFNAVHPNIGECITAWYKEMEVFIIMHPSDTSLDYKCDLHDFWMARPTCPKCSEASSQCARCHDRRYCCREHQKNDYPWHKHECTRV